MSASGLAVHKSLYLGTAVFGAIRPAYVSGASGLFCGNGGIVDADGFNGETAHNDQREDADEAEQNFKDHH